MRLPHKLALFFMLLSMIPIIIMGWLSYRNSSEIIEKQTINHLISTNISAEAEFDRWVHGNVVSLEILAHDDHLQNEISAVIAVEGTSNIIYPDKHRRSVEGHLLPLVKRGGFIELFILQAGTGLAIFSTNRRQEGKYFDNQPFLARGKSQTYIQNVYYSMALQQPTMTISTPLKDRHGRPAAVIAGHLDLAELSKIMEKRRGLSQTEDTYLVNKFNFFVTEPRFGKDYALKKSVHTEGVKAALAHEAGVGFYDDYCRVPIIGAYQWLA